jgi:hypothetical protein
MKGKRTDIYRKAIEDGFVKASSHYIRPGTLIKISTLLKNALWEEKEIPHSVNDIWEYDKETGFISEPKWSSDEHYLY